MPVDAGDPAPPINLPDHEGNPWRLGDHAGRPVLLVFHRHVA